ARHAGLATELALSADLARNPGHLAGEAVELIDHRVDGVLQLEDLAPDVDGDLLREVTLGDGRGHFGDVAHLGGEVAGHVVDVVGEVLPDARDPLDLGLAAELTLGADLAGHPGDFRCVAARLSSDVVDGVLELEDLAPDVDGDLLRQVAVGDRRGDVGDVADLGRQVGRHQVDVVGQVFPDPGGAL